MNHRRLLLRGVLLMPRDSCAPISSYANIVGVDRTLPRSCDVKVLRQWLQQRRVDGGGGGAFDSVRISRHEAGRFLGETRQ